MPLIKLEAIASDPPAEIIQVDGGTLSIGRGTENHVVVDSEAVSRRHAALVGTDTHWVFKDFGSTNGSWINGIRLTPGQMKLLRDGDVVQLADFPMRLVWMERGADQTGPSLLVFYNEHFESEFVLAKDGPPFAIGGPNGVFFLQGVPNEESQVEISYTGLRLELVAGPNSAPVIVNSMATRGVAALSDRDEVDVGPYRIIVNDAASGHASAAASRFNAGCSPTVDKDARAYDRPNLPAHLKPANTAADDWESEASRRMALSGKKFVFGTTEDETTSTLGVSARAHGASVGFEMNASQRFAQAIVEAEKRKGAAISEGLLVFFGVMVFILLIGFLVYFFQVMS